MSHGTISCVTATVDDIAASLADYRDHLGLEVVHNDVVSDQLAAAWGALDIAGSKQAILQPRSGALSYYRLIEQPLHDGFIATTTHGWAAFELTVQDVFSWPEKLNQTGFKIVGPPRHIAGLDHLIAMQMVGRGQEMVYLNEVRDDTPTTDLPRAQSPIDKTFICILAAPNREAAVQWYTQTLALDEAETFVIPYSSINRALDLPSDHTTTLTMVHEGRMPIIEVDQYPDIAITRPQDRGLLPPGNAIVSLEMRNLNKVNCEAINAPQTFDHAPYNGRVSACYHGPAGELLELIELD